MTFFKKSHMHTGMHIQLSKKKKKTLKKKEKKKKKKKCKNFLKKIHKRSPEYNGVGRNKLHSYILLYN